MNYALLIISYIIGSFPSGKILAKLNGVDLSTQGSGNIGATNVARTLGKKAGILVLLSDLLKGALAVLLAFYLTKNNHLSQFAGLFAVLGHCISIPKLLKGGKGVAAGFGAVIAMNPLVAGAAAIVFLIVFKLKKIVSLASIIAASSLPLLGYIITSDPTLATTLLLIAIVIVLRHKSNITKLLRGEESAFKVKKEL